MRYGELRLVGRASFVGLGIMSGSRQNDKQTYGAVSPSAPPPAPELQQIPASQRWDGATKRSVLIILLIAVVFGLWLSRAILPWIIFSAILAYLLNPIVDLLTRIHIPRTIGTIFVFALGVSALILLPIFLLPAFIDQVVQLTTFDVSRAAQDLLNTSLRAINELPDQVILFGFAVPTSNVVQQVEQGVRQFTFVPTLSEAISYVQQAVATATGLVSSTAALSVAVVGRIVQGVITGIVIFFISLYLTKDYPQIRRYIENLFPASYQPELRELIRRMGRIWSSFFRGQIILCLAVGFVTWVVLTLVGMPGALVLAIVAGILEIAPNIGPIIATIPAVIVALLQGSTVLAQYGVSNLGFALITIAAYFLIQQAEANFLVPRIIGDSVNLHPVVVIVGVAVGFNAFGILGAFLAAPTLATLRLIGSYLHAKLLDYPPFQASVASIASATASYRLRVTGEQLHSEASRPVPALTAESTPPATASAPAPEGHTAPDAPDAPRISPSTAP